MIDRDTTTKILETANIVDVVSEFVTLRKAGANYKGLCPFHNERTPSFSVSPARNYAHCFSCGKGGSPVGFIMEHEQMTYPEALRWLAQKYHIEIKEKEMTDDERKEQSERESMFIINDFVAKYYQEILHKDPNGIAIGMQYFRSRGFRDDIIEKFRLGFALDDKQAMPKTAIGKSYNPQLLVKTGLCYVRGGRDGETPKPSADNLIDRFAGRAIFPWISMSGKVVAFGGRKLDKETKGVQQKYVNSPESIIYHKDHELYGIYQAKKQIAKDNCVYMVEGYTDVISMHQCGIENVVANSGTALSIHQIRMLHRLTNNIILLYDGDAAGIHAALRGTDMLLAEGMNIKVLILPDGDDPDSFSRKHTAEEFKAYVEAHQTDFIQFKTSVLLDGVTDPIKRSEAISSIVKSISLIPDTIIRATYIQDCSTRFKMREQTLIDQMNRFIRQTKEQERKQTERNQQNESSSTAQTIDEQTVGPASPTSTTATSTPSKPTQTSLPVNNSIEALLVKCVVRYGEQILFDNVELEDGTLISLTVAQYIGNDLASDNFTFSNPVYNTILSEAVERSHQPNFFAAPYFSQHPDINISQVASQMIIDKYTLSKSLEMNMSIEALRQHVDHLILEYRMNIIDARMKSLLNDITSSVDNEERTATLMAEYQRTQKLRNILAHKLGRHM